MKLLCVICCFPLFTIAQSLEQLGTSLDLLYADIVEDGLIDYNEASNQTGLMEDIYEQINQIQLHGLSANDQKAFLIDAYNFITIKQITEHLPVVSIKRIKSFFQQKHPLGESYLSLNEIEARLQEMGNADIHMVLVCGALSCPPFPSQSFTTHRTDLPAYIKQAVDTALSSEVVLQVNTEESKILISNIFRWYETDFGNIKNWLSTYTGKDFSNYSINYLDYDWSLNDYHHLVTERSSVNHLENRFRYFSSRLYERGQYEVNWFNNYYSQWDTGEGGIRTNFFTATLQPLFGLSGRINIGVDVRFRSASSGPAAYLGTFDALSFSNEGVITFENDALGYRRTGLSAVGPRVKYQPFLNIPNITFQHTLLIPTVGKAEGGIDVGGFLDWGAPSLLSDLFYDQEIGAKGSIFLQIGLHIENTNQAFFRYGDGYYQLSTPVTVIYNYFANKKLTIYGLINSAPRWGYSVTNDGNQTDIIPDSYHQLGLGWKYFLTDRIQAEILYTKFFTAIQNRKADTFNVGVRYYGW